MARIGISTIKQAVCVIALVLLVVGGDKAALAQLQASLLDTPSMLTSSGSQTPKISNGFTVAVIYQKLIGKMPDLEKWAQNTEEYLNADPLDQATILENKVKAMTDAFSLILVTEPIIVSQKVTISQFSSMNRGFLVTSGMDENTFFKFSFGGMNFALIPQQISNYVWLPADGVVARDIEAAAAANNRELEMVLWVKANYAKPNEPPVDIDGAPHYLMSGEIADMTLYAPGLSRKLWEVPRNTSYQDNDNNDLINLKQ